MQKKTSVTLLVSLVLLFSVLYVYTETRLINQNGYFNYHVSDFIGYLFYWSTTLFFVSLFAFVLDDKKYKVWSLITLPYVLLSILIAYGTGDGNGAIVSFDGEMVTWFFAGIYSFISIIYFIFQFFKNRNSYGK